MYCNCCCSCSFEPEIIKIGQSSHKMYSNNILNFQESTTVLNACTKKVCKLIERTSYVSIIYLSLRKHSHYTRDENQNFFICRSFLLKLLWMKNCRLNTNIVQSFKFYFILINFFFIEKWFRSLCSTWFLRLKKKSSKIFVEKISKKIWFEVLFLFLVTSDTSASLLSKKM